MLWLLHVNHSTFWNFTQLGLVQEQNIPRLKAMRNGVGPLQGVPVTLALRMTQEQAGGRIVEGVKEGFIQENHVV